MPLKTSFCPLCVPAELSLSAILTGQSHTLTLSLLRGLPLRRYAVPSPDSFAAFLPPAPHFPRFAQFFSSPPSPMPPCDCESRLRGGAADDGRLAPPARCPPLTRSTRDATSPRAPPSLRFLSPGAFRSACGGGGSGPSSLRLAPPRDCAGEKGEGGGSAVARTHKPGHARTGRAHAAATARARLGSARLESTRPRSARLGSARLAATRRRHGGRSQRHGGAGGAASRRGGGRCG